MNAEQQRLERLLERARKERPLPVRNSDPSPPLGFSTRVAAQWASCGNGRSTADSWELVARWGSACATVVCLLALVYQHQMAPPATGLDLLLELPPAESPF